jgi:predicted MFS family arabinose efflux permease
VQNQQPIVRPGRVARAASVLYAGVWAALILSPLGNDFRLAFALAWTSTLVYLGTLIVTAAAILELRREKRSGRQLPSGLLRG